MSSEVDNRVVRMDFDNKKFEENVRTTLKSLTKLKESSDFKDTTKNFSGLEKAARSLSTDGLAGIASGVDALQRRFSTLGIIGMTALQNITNTAINTAKKVVTTVGGAIVQGGIKRARNLEQANFQLQGLLKDEEAVKAVMDNVNAAVDGTAYGLDAAAMVASQLAASGMRAGDKLEGALKGIAGVAAMTSSEYEDIGRVFTQVAGNGRLMGDQLLQLSSRGINAAATLKDFWNDVASGSKTASDEVTDYIKKTHSAANVTEADIRDMVSKGKINFEVFAEAMNDAFGEHAKAANDTFAGSLSNVKAALSRIGAKFATPGLTDLRDIFNALRPAINKFNEELQPFVNFVVSKMDLATEKIVKFFNVLANSKDNRGIWKTMDMISRRMPKIYENFVQVFRNIKHPIEVFANIFKASFHDIFGEISTGGSYLRTFLNVLRKGSEWLANFTSKLYLKGSTQDALKNVLKGIFSILNTGKNIVLSFGKAFSGIFSHFAPIKDAVLGLASDIGLLFIKFNEFSSESGIFDTIFGFISTNLIPIIDAAVSGIVGLINALRGFINLDFSKVVDGFKKLKDIFSPLINFLKNLKGIFSNLAPYFQKVFSFLGDGLKYLSDKISEFFEGKKFSFKNIAEAGLFGGLLYGAQTVYKKIKGFLIKMKNATSDMSIFQYFDKIRTSLMDTFLAMQRDLKADMLMKLAKAIALLAASLLVISLIDPDRLVSAMTAITVLMTELTGMMSILEGQFNKSKGFGGKLGIMAMGMSLISFAGAILILSAAVSILAKMDPDKMAAGLGGVAALMLELAGFMELMKLIESKKVKTPKGLIKIALALLLLSVVVKILGDMDPEKMGQGLLAIGVLIVELAGFFALLKASGAEKIKPNGLIKMAAALLILTFVAKILGDMDPEKLGQGLLALGLMIVELAGFFAILKASKIEKTGGMAAGLLVMAAAMVIFSHIIKTLGAMDPKKLVQGLIGMAAAIYSIAGALAIMDNGSLKSAAGILVVALAIGLLVPSLLLLGAVPVKIIAQGLIAMGVALGLFVGAAYLLQGMEKTLLAVGGGVALFGIGLAAAGVGVILFTTALLTLAASAAAVTAGIIALVRGIIAGIGEFFRGIKSIAVDIEQGIEFLIELAIKAISRALPTISDAVFNMIEALLDTLIEHIPTIVNKIVDLIIKVLDALGTRIPEIISAIAKFINTIFNELSKYNPPSLESIISGLLGITAIITILQFLPLTAGLKAVLLLGEFIAGFVAILAVLGALNQIPGFSWIIGEGAEVLGQIGDAIGMFVGRLIGALGEGITMSLPNIAANLSDFAANLVPFLAVMQLVDPAVLEGVKNIAEAILILTAADLVEQFASFLTGGTDFAEMGKKFAEFAPYMKQFADEMAGVDPAVVEASANAGKALAEMAKAMPNEGGLISFFTGDNDIGEFGGKLVTFGESLKSYGDAVSGLDDSGIAASVNAGTQLAELAKQIPNSGGLLGWFAGENDIGEFGSSLLTFGESIRDYCAAVLGIDDSGVAASVSAGATLADLAKQVPNSGGFISWFTGNNNLDDFGDKIVVFGKAIKDYGDAVKDMEITNLSPSVSAASILIRALSQAGGVPDTTLLPSFGINLGKFAPGFVIFANAIAGATFGNETEGISLMVAAINFLSGKEIPTGENLTLLGAQLQNVGPMLASFANSVDGVAFASANSAINTASKWADFLQSINDISIGSVQDFREAINTLKTVDMAGLEDAFSQSAFEIENTIKGMFSALKAKFDGQKGKFKSYGVSLMSKFKEGLESKKGEIKTAISTIITQATSGITSGGFYSAGQNATQGFINGLKSKNFELTRAGKEIAELALEAAKKRLNEFSPSKEMYKIGAYATEGFILGIGGDVRSVTAAGKEIAEFALDAIATTMALAEDNGVFTPTITPVLDLTNVQNGISSMNSMMTGRSYSLAASTGMIMSPGSNLLSGINARNAASGNSDILQSLGALRAEVASLHGDVANMKVVMDSGALVGSIAPKMDAQLGKMAVYKGRGN